MFMSVNVFIEISRKLLAKKIVIRITRDVLPFT